MHWKSIVALIAVGLWSVAAPSPSDGADTSTTDPTIEKGCVAAATATPNPFRLLRMGRQPFKAHGYDYAAKAFLAVGIQQLPKECGGLFRANGLIRARFKDSKHRGWWLDASGDVSYAGPQNRLYRIDTFLLRNGEVGCLKAVKLTLSVKVINLTNGATAAKRSFRRPAQRLTCGGRPIRKPARGRSGAADHRHFIQAGTSASHQAPATSCRGRTTMKCQLSKMEASVAPNRSAAAITEASTVSSGRSWYSATSSAMRTGSAACNGPTVKFPAGKSPRKRTSACQPRRVAIR